MNIINEIFCKYGDEYLNHFRFAIPKQHIKTMRAISNCRSGNYGTTFYKCDNCGKVHSVHRSCGNRHCPNCQNHKTKLWIKKQIDNRLPVHYFMVTFTVPKTLRKFLRSNQKKCYSALFKSSSDTLKQFLTNKKSFKADTSGFFGVLHTWGRQLQYHPHIHYMIPGGVLSKEKKEWIMSGKKFLVPVRALSKVFKAKFRDQIIKLGFYHSINEAVWKSNWIVHCKPVGNGENCMKYLSAYVFKVAISEKRIIKIENRKVIFKYRDKKTGKYRVMALDVMEFMRRFLQHVLPSGFMKIRYYGFVHPAFGISLEDLKDIIVIKTKKKLKEIKSEIKVNVQALCSECNKPLTYLFAILPKGIRVEPAP